MISVIIPVYNSENTIEKCVRSLKDQTCGDFEVIAVDDGSSDKSMEVYTDCTEGDDRFRLLRNEKKGVSSARNTGIRAAKGEWLFFLDSDDWLEKDSFKVLLAMAKQNNSDITAMEYVKEFNGVTEKHEFYREPKRWSGDEMTEFIRASLIPQTGIGMSTSKLIRRSLLVDNDIYYSEELSAAEDAELMVRCCSKAGSASYIPYYGYRYMIGTGSAVRSFREDYADRYIKSLSKIEEFISSDDKLNGLKETYYSCVLYHLLLCVVNYSFHPDRPGDPRTQVSDFKNLIKRPIFARALKHVHLGDFSMTRKITLILIKLKMYRLVRLVALYRQRQLRRQ